MEMERWFCSQIQFSNNFKKLCCPKRDYQRRQNESFLRLNNSVSVALLASSLAKTDAYGRLYYHNCHSTALASSTMPALGSRPSSLGPSLEMQDESCTTWMRCSIPYSAISMTCFAILSFHIYARVGHPPISLGGMSRR